MNKKLIEYLIIAATIIILLYACFTIVSYNFPVKHATITDSISMNYPATSGCTVEGDTVKFRNSLYDFYDMDVSKLNSSDEKVAKLMNNFANLNKGTFDYKNESCYLITFELDDDNGYKYHSMLVPSDSFSKDNMSFKKDTQVYMFEGKDKQFVVKTAFDSQVVM